MNRAPRTTSILILLALTLITGDAFAGGGGGLPWEGPLQQIADSLTGPVAFVVSLLCVVGAGCALAFGGQMNDFLRTILIVVLVIAMLVTAGGLISMLFGVSGAVIATVGGMPGLPLA